MLYLSVVQLECESAGRIFYAIWRKIKIHVMHSFPRKLVKKKRDRKIPALFNIISSSLFV